MWNGGLVKWKQHLNTYTSSTDAARKHVRYHRQFFRYPVRVYLKMIAIELTVRNEAVGTTALVGAMENTPTWWHAACWSKAITSMVS